MIRRCSVPTVVNLSFVVVMKVKLLVINQSCYTTTMNEQEATRKAACPNKSGYIVSYEC